MGRSSIGAGGGEDLGHGPAFAAAEGAGLGDPDPVTHAAAVGFVVGLVAGGAADRLLIDGMGEAVFHRHHHRFVHLVADDGADPFLECHEDARGESGGDGGALALLLHRQQVGQLDAGLLEAVRVLQAAGGLLEAEIEQFAADAVDLFADLGVAQGAHVGDGGTGHGQDSTARAGSEAAASWSAKVRNFVLTGSLYWARRIASLAILGVISGPPISKRMRPGLITATQNSGLPLPEPMRVSAGRMVTGLSGKIRIQILPPRLT